MKEMQLTHTKYKIVSIKNRTNFLPNQIYHKKFKLHYSAHVGHFYFVWVCNTNFSNFFHIFNFLFLYQLFFPLLFKFHLWWKILVCNFKLFFYTLSFSLFSEQGSEKKKNFIKGMFFLKISISLNYTAKAIEFWVWLIT